VSEQVIDLPLPVQSQWAVVRGCALQVLAALASGVAIGFVVGFFGGATGLISQGKTTVREIAFFQQVGNLSILMAGATYLFFARDGLRERLRQFLPDLMNGLRRPLSLLILFCVPLGLLGTLHWGMTTPQIAKNFLHDVPPVYWLTIAIPVVIVAPVAEEVFFRGYVWDRLSTVMPSWKAGTISAALFLGPHIFNGIVAPLFVLPLTIILTVLRLRRAGLGVCVAGHLIYNGTIILGNFLQTYVARLHIAF
jgi:membrane protease YdiL (CAAX protease family)